MENTNDEDKNIVRQPNDSKDSAPHDGSKDSAPHDGSPTGVGGPDYPLASQTKIDRLERRALNQRWPITEEQRRRAIERQVEIATSSGSSNREATSAAACLVKMEQQNQNDDTPGLAGSNTGETKVVFYIPDNGRGDSDYGRESLYEDQG